MRQRKAGTVGEDRLDATGHGEAYTRQACLGWLGLFWRDIIRQACLGWVCFGAALYGRQDATWLGLGLHGRQGMDRGVFEGFG